MVNAGVRNQTDISPRKVYGTTRWNFKMTFGLYAGFGAQLARRTSPYCMFPKNAG